jgi:hypothetical protein
MSSTLEIESLFILAGSWNPVIHSATRVGQSVAAANFRHVRTNITGIGKLLHFHKKNQNSSLFITPQCLDYSTCMRMTMTVLGNETETLLELICSPSKTTGTKTDFRSAC